VLSELKKKEGMLESVNTALLRTLNPEKVAVDRGSRTIGAKGPDLISS
jgi:hypothetical protein